MPSPTAHCKLIERDSRRVLALAGRLDAAGLGKLWRPAIRSASEARGMPLAVDVSDVSSCDTTGATLLAELEAAHGRAEIVGASSQVTALLQRARLAIAHPAPAALAPVPLRTRLAALMHTGADRIAFAGELACSLLALPLRRRMIRPVEFARHAEQAGTRSLPLVLMLGYLMGLILAFQSAIPMRRFGADIYVANLVAISLLRELGPLLAAVILAGRTGSAFAAEIGTMKVNEELDALATMGLHPMTMLALPRLAAVMLVIPAMTLMLELAGLAGMATVMRSFGFPLAAIAHQVRAAVTLSDLLGGLGKSVVFGMTVAAIGCRAGLGTGTGPRAVGQAATAAVVGGIIATIVLDGVFALLFYRLGL